MSKQHRPLFAAQVFALAVTVLLSFGGFDSLFSQIPNLAERVSRSDGSPNPQVDFNHPVRKRAENRAKQPSDNLPRPSSKSASDTQPEDIERVIQDGNAARDKNDYEQALDHYKKAKDPSPKEWSASNQSDGSCANGLLSI